MRLSRLSLAVLCAVLLLAGCPDRQRQGGGAAGFAPALTIAYIGNFRGFQRPCGCVADQNGGIIRARVASEMIRSQLSGEPDEAAELPAGVRLPELTIPQPLKLVECGNFANRRDRQAGLRSQTHLRVLENFGAAGAILGSEEVALPKEEAQTGLQTTTLPLVSCNVEATLDGISVQPSLELEPGWHLIGVTVPGPDGVADWAVVGDAEAEVRSALKQLPPGSRAIIAAAQLSPPLARKLAAIRGVEAVIGYAPPSGEWPDELAPALPPPAFRATELTLASFSTEARPLSWPVALTDAWPDDERIAELLRQGNAQRLAAAREDPEQWKKTSWTMTSRFLAKKPAPTPAEETYVGADACLACHSESHSTWKDTKHAHSYDVLLEHNEAQTLDCLECHTTGLLLPGGYDPQRSWDVLADPKARVGCESCHGPGQAHVQLAEAGKLRAGMSEDELKILRSDLTTCLRCHDEYNSPNFKAAEYWAKIRH